MIRELGGEGYQDGVEARFDDAVRLLTEAGAEVVEVSCPSFVHALAAYYLIMPSEASSNLARFDAMRYGLRVIPEGIDNPSAEDVMRATRDAGFGEEVKRRIILGTYALSSGYYDAYYGQAQKVRTLIQRDFAAAFEQADVLVSPTAPTTAFRIGEKLDDPLAMYLNDIATIPANLAGVPGISVPSGLADEDGLPGRRPGAGPGPRRRPALPGGRRAGDTPAAGVGRALAGQGARARGGRPMTDALVDFDSALEQFDPALGLEVHVELNTASKMFCGCPTEFGAEPNTQTCPTCLGLPGSMPVVNRSAVESAMRIGLALNCEIAEWCRFARKNYFYPDMPKNFQTSQYDEPIAFDGEVEVEVDGDDVPGRDRARAHGGGHRQVAPCRQRRRPDPRRRLLAGRLQPRRHPADRDRHPAGHGHGCSRPGRRPRLRRPAPRAAARASVSPTSAWSRGRCAATSTCRSRPRARARLGTRTETKNVNSLRSVERAVRYEIGRHAAVLGGGGSILQETRHWHEDTGVTTSGREKSDAEDYRYFPEPDLVPVAPSREWVEQLRSDAAGAAAREARAAAAGLGLQRPRHARHDRRRGARAGRGDDRGRRLTAGRPQVVAR